MNRRDFLKRIIAVPLAVKAASSVEVLEQLDVSRINTVDYFYGRAAGGGKSEFQLHGIPFYENAATYRHGYMGISRELWSKAMELPTPENITQKSQDK